jgi:hypothetical protein
VGIRSLKFITGLVSIIGGLVLAAEMESFVGGMLAMVGIPIFFTGPQSLITSKH